MTEPLHIVLASSIAQRDPAIARWITSGRGSLAFILGDVDCRYRLLAQAINWDRVLIACRNGVPLGYAAFKQHRRGPFSPGIRPFINEFGLLSGLLRYGLFAISECREWRYGFYLYGLRVRKTARRQGVASALLHATCERAQDSGHRTIELEVQANNLGARALYARHGFTSIHRFPVTLNRLLPVPTVLNLRRRLSPHP
ncbi:Acetyltransferase (GNAT) family protein [Pseudomonas sp. ok272]|uniref:GNAT family N-acetyltransferase n=1 Tax=unclassified Pseudomonas TaxID=196821 RepID=UPI0008B1E0BB|nr:MULTISPECIES: GNAT family N-acetyltransferase [unclassified Pseudomonas]SEM99193.1 Acetyltransferase (GNAT) family protein [Pseudomonas sp. ok272]SFM90052.1 Acetyltransferase (GNAT) family protein [Pseudomonas sp. ok602]